MGKISLSEAIKRKYVEIDLRNLKSKSTFKKVSLRDFTKPMNDLLYGEKDE
jgi:hypothetical protein